MCPRAPFERNGMLRALAGTAMCDHLRKSPPAAYPVLGAGARLNRESALCNGAWSLVPSGMEHLPEGSDDQATSFNQPTNRGALRCLASPTGSAKRCGLLGIARWPIGSWCGSTN
jgi:hypothetical protein